jgi:transposase
MGVTMRGDDGICGKLFSCIDLEKRVRADHPLRVIREVANTALKSLTGEFAKLYSPIGRESIPPERLMRLAAAGVLFDPLGTAIGRADRL